MLSGDRCDQERQLCPLHQPLLPAQLLREGWSPAAEGQRKIKDYKERGETGRIILWIPWPSRFFSAFLAIHFSSFIIQMTVNFLNFHWVSYYVYRQFFLDFRRYIFRSNVTVKTILLYYCIERWYGFVHINLGRCGIERYNLGRVILCHQVCRNITSFFSFNRNGDKASRRSSDWRQKSSLSEWDQLTSFLFTERCHKYWKCSSLWTLKTCWGRDDGRR